MIDVLLTKVVEYIQFMEKEGYERNDVIEEWIEQINNRMEDGEE